MSTHNLVETLTYDEMEKFLTDPTTRIVDSRMLEMYSSFSFTLQVLCHDNIIRQVEEVPEYKHLEDGSMLVASNSRWHKRALDLFRLQYRNSPRMNPALYGLLDAADAESRVEQTAPISAQQPE